MAHQVCLIPGDGIGPEISRATSQIIDASGADIEAYDTVLTEGDREVLTPDIGGNGGTRQFTEAVLARL